MNVAVLSESGEQTGTADLNDEIFAAKVNVGLMHQVVTAQLAAGRQGTHKVKTRSEVRGGGRKPYRQKGTGRARHGSTREPQWVGGGTTHGPVPRSYAKDVNKKMKAVALRSALTTRAADSKIVVVADLDFEAPKTKRAVAALDAWKLEGKVLYVSRSVESHDSISLRNLPHVHLLTEQQLNVYDVLNADVVVFTSSALDAFQTRAAKLPGRRAAVAAAAARAADADIVLETGGEG